MGRRKKDSINTAMHNDLKGFNIKINEFGEIRSSFPVDKLNLFLNYNLNDKKFRDLNSTENNNIDKKLFDSGQ